MPYLGKSPTQGVRQRYQYTATAGQTTFSGTDSDNLTLTYTDANFVDVYQNGVLLKGGGTDYTATTGTSVVLATGASVSDVIEIIVYDVFAVANHVKKSGDIMTGQLQILTTDNSAGLLLESSDADAADAPKIDLYRNSASPGDTDDIGQIQFNGQNSAGEKIMYASIFAETDDVTDGTENGALVFNLEDGGALNRMVQIGTDETVFNTNGLDINFRVESDDNTHMIFVDAGNDHVNIGTSTDYGGVLNVLSTDANDTLTLVSTDNGSNAGPDLVLFRDSSSPADNDFMGSINFRGDDSGGNVSTYAQIIARALDVTSATEDGQLLFVIDKAGTLVSGLNVGSSEVVVNDDSADMDLRVESNNNANMLFVDGGNDHVNIGTSTDHGGVLNVESTDNTATLVLVSTDDDENVGPVLNLTRNSASPADLDLLGEINFFGKNDAGENIPYALIDSRIRDASDGTEAGRLRFATFLNGSEFSRMDMDSDETVFNEGGTDINFRVEGNTDTALFFVDASEDSVMIDSTGIGADGKFSVNGTKNGAFGLTCLRLRDTDTSANSSNTMMVCQYSEDGNATGATYISFRDSAAEIGKINVASSSSVSYGTTSDYRVKENVKPMADVWDKVKALKPVNFTWKKDPTDSAVDGFIAHELQEIFPQAVTGEKDEMVTRADGTKEMEVQSVDYGKLSTLLAKGLQEAMAKIETLEAKVTALESK